MPGQTTIEKQEPGSELDEHTESVGLFSTTGKCYGNTLPELIGRLEPRLTNYGETIKAVPHTNCLDTVVKCTADENRRLIERSIWLIECKCVLDEQYCRELRHVIRATFPHTANGIIWIDDSRHTITQEQKDDIEAFSTKTKVVDSQQSLLDKLEDYLEFYNPYFTSANVVAWMNEVHNAQKRLD